MPPFANLFRSRKRLDRTEAPVINSPKEGATKMKNTEPTYVTREEFDGLAEKFAALTNVVGAALAGVELASRRAGYADGSVSHQLQLAERSASMPEAERAALKQIVKTFDAAMRQYRAAEQRSDHERGNAYHRISG